MDPIQEHNDKLMAAFGKVLVSEEHAAQAKARLDEATTMLSLKKSETDTALAAAWGEVAALLNETGEVEITLSGDVMDFKVGWTTPRESVKADSVATPDEFVKLERKPMLKDIGEHLKGLRDSGRPMPNWASFQAGEPKLQWRAVKKTSKLEKGSV